jgi:hypothetical protein
MDIVRKIKKWVEDKDKSKDKNKFNHLLMVAEKIYLNNPRSLPDFVNLILRPLQAEFNIAVAEKGTNAIQNVNCSLLFGKFIHNYLWDDNNLRAVQLEPSKYTVSLNYHIVLPRAWDLDRYIDNLSSIGKRKNNVPWVQDYNHDVEVWLPWGLVFVNGGNHSIMTGIVASEGKLIPESVCDYSYLLDEIYTDGVYWFDQNSKNILSKVVNYRIAAVFEIGRLMKKSNCSADIFMVKV